MAVCFGTVDALAVSWLPYGPDGGDARAFAVDPSDHLHVYLGAANGWIYQSKDEGKSWIRLANIDKRDDLVVDNILVDPADPKHLVVGVYALVGKPDGGLFVSRDEGLTWTAQEDLKGQSVRSLVAAPSDPKMMLAGTLEGVFRSTDAGDHWQQISPKGDKELHEIESLAVDPVDPKTIYAGTWHLPWKTTDGGATWQHFKNGIAEDSDVFSIIVDPKQSKTIYLSACSGIYMSTDGAENFGRAQGIPHTAIRTRVLMQDPNHPATVFGGTTGGLYRTDDAGKTWKLITSPETIVNDVFVDPVDSQHVLLATDRGGVLLSADGGKTFAASNSGFSARQITGYTADAQHPATIYVGVVNDKASGGVFVSKSGGLDWAQLSSGLGGRDAYSLGQAPDGTILAGTQHGIFRLRESAWEGTKEEIPKVVPRAGKAKAGGKPVPSAPVVRQLTEKQRSALPKMAEASVFQFAVTGDAVFAGTSQGLLRSVTNGATWSKVTSIPMDEYRFLAASKLNLVAASLTSVEVSVDSGETWHGVPLPEKITQVSSLSVDGDGGVWVAGREAVYTSTDQGSTWQVPKDLYVRNANCIFYDAAKNRMLIASTVSTMVFTVDLATKAVTSSDTGWSLRFVRPVGDHLVAGTFYDGMVLEPRMTDSPGPGTPPAAQ